MANNFNQSNVYTTKIPTGTLNNVQLTQPTNVKIQWPDRTGGNVPTSIKPSFLRKLFG